MRIHDEARFHELLGTHDSIAVEERGDAHLPSSMTTPLRADAFELDDELKIELIEKHFREIMLILELDLNDDGLRGTPHRVAKMYVKEIFSGLNPANKPSISLFDNIYQSRRMLVEENISFHSNCEHHFVPFHGRVHVAYVPNGKVVGLSKLNCIVRYFARRPQVQERLTMQIANEIKQALGTDDVAVMIDAAHMSISTRGVQDHSSSTVTAEYSG